MWSLTKEEGKKKSKNKDIILSVKEDKLILWWSSDTDEAADTEQPHWACAKHLQFTLQ